MKKINIFWTGGFDSTYRMCELSLFEVEIQPYYLRPNKKSVSHELSAMEKISERIRLDQRTKANILPLIIFGLDEVEEDEEVTNAFKKVLEEVTIGDQYLWLARYAKQQGIKVELGIEHTTNGKVESLFSKYGGLTKVSIPISSGDHIEYYEVSSDLTANFIKNLYGDCRFPLPLYRMTKKQVLEAYELIGYEDVISMTWFCAHPIFGKPCGLCYPCATVMKEGLGFRIPFVSKILYKVFKGNSAGRYFDKKLKAVYNRNWRK